MLCPPGAGLFSERLLRNTEVQLKPQALSLLFSVIDFSYDFAFLVTAWVT